MNSITSWKAKADLIDIYDPYYQSQNFKQNKYGPSYFINSIINESKKAYKRLIKEDVSKMIGPNCKLDIVKVTYGNDPLYEKTFKLIDEFVLQGKKLAINGKQAGLEGNDIDPDYQAWNIAREKYRSISLNGGDPHLRDAEHFLFRKWISFKVHVEIPDGLPFMNRGYYNPTVNVSKDFFELFHDPAYNLLRKTILEKIFDISPTSPEMLKFEAWGFEIGKCLRENL